MKTTATNRKIRMLIVAIGNESLIPRPEFQRRLVWTTKDKQRFLDTVLNGYPFPEIYIAAGNVNAMTAEGTELLVDGQQRVTTLYQYFIGSPELKLSKDILPYNKLPKEKQGEFLEYEVVVRDLGRMELPEIQEVFERINATKYSLNDMEVHNARFAGEFKSFAEAISQDSFFEEHRIFSANEMRRMRDVSFAITFIITIMSTYFNREDEFEAYLSTYNDEFDRKEQLQDEIFGVFKFIDACNFSEKSRAWKRSDLLTLLVEVHRAIVKQKLEFDPIETGEKLQQFYWDVENPTQIDPQDTQRMNDATVYAKEALQGTNDRGARITRGEIIQRVLNLATSPEQST